VPVRAGQVYRLANIQLSDDVHSSDPARIFTADAQLIETASANTLFVPQTTSYYGLFTPTYTASGLPTGVTISAQAENGVTLSFDQGHGRHSKLDHDGPNTVLAIDTVDVPVCSLGRHFEDHNHEYIQSSLLDQPDPEPGTLCPAWVARRILCQCGRSSVQHSVSQWRLQSG
jgi:hypothetical protein